MPSPVKYLSALIPGSDMLTKAGFYTLCLTLFLMPFPRSWSLYSLGAFLFCGLLLWLTGSRPLTDIFIKKLVFILPPVAYFMIHFIYFLFDPRWTYIEDKLMFLLIPLFGLPVIASDYFQKRFRIIIISFLAGLGIIFCYQLIRATFESLSLTEGSLKFNPLISPGVSRYNWQQLSTLEHPTYLAIKTIWAIILLYLAGSSLSLSKSLKILLILLFTTFVFLLSSRAGILIMVLLFIYLTWLQIKSIKIRILLLFLIPLIFAGAFRLTILNTRMKSEFSEIRDKFTFENFDFKNIHFRTRAMYTAMMLIREHPLLGVGLDARRELTEEYKRRGYNVEAEWRLNAHSQYLETQLTFGIPGTMILIWMLLAPYIKRKSTWNHELIVPFLIIATVSMLFESILVRQWGIMFFVLFCCILTIPEKNARQT
jgi:O-antigen ligase